MGGKGSGGGHSAFYNWNPSGPSPAGGGGGKAPKSTRQATPRGSSNEGPTQTPSFDPAKTRQGGGKMPDSNAAKRAAGTAAATLLGNWLLGPVGGAYGAQKGYQSTREGWMGDMLNSRDNEEARDRMEDAGISRKDTALASKHGIANSYSSSLLEEGQDYDSVTGEYF